MQGREAGAFGGIPENYFKELPDKIIGRIDENRQRSKAFYLRPSLMAVAAGLLILIGLGIVMVFQNNRPEMDFAHNGKLTDSLAEMIALNNMQDKGLQDTARPVLKNGEEKERMASGNDNLDDLFAELDKIPLDILVEYLIFNEEINF